MALETTISNLPVADALVGVEVLPIVQTGDTKKTTVSGIRAFTDVTASAYAASAQSTAIATASGYTDIKSAQDVATASGYAVDSLNTGKAYTDGKIATLSGYVDGKITTLSGQTAFLVDPLFDFKTWDATRTYTINDPTFEAGVPYRSLIAGNINNTPSTNPDKWEVTGGGANASNPGINFENGEFESSIIGWAVYKDVAQATPVSGTGGSPVAISFTRSTVSGLIGSASAILTKTAASGIGEGVAYDFTVDPGARQSPIKITFPYYSDAGYADSDVGVYIYDITNAVVIQPSIVSIPRSGPYSSKFECSAWLNSNSGSYRLIFHVQSGSALAWNLKIDNVQVQSLMPFLGAVISEWQSYSPSISGINVGTGGMLTGYWRRVGGNFESTLKILLGTAPSVTGYSQALPMALSIDYGKVSTYARLGFAGYYDASATAAGNLTPVEIVTPNLISLAITGTSPTTWAVGDQIYLSYSVPIAQWSANTNLASDFTEYASNDCSGGVAAGVTYSTGMKQGSEGSLIPSGIVSNVITGWSSTKYKVTFIRPIQATDKLELETCYLGKWYSADVLAPTITMVTSVYGMSIDVSAVDANSIHVNFGNAGMYPTGTTYGSAGSSWTSVGTGWRWRLRKISNGNTAEVPPLVRAEYSKNTVQTGTTTNAIIDYNVKVEDTHNAVTIGSGWKFMAPIAGMYLIDYNHEANAGNTNWSYFTITIFKNNILLRRVELTKNDKSSAIPFGLEGQNSFSIRLLAGEYIDLRLATDIVTSANLGFGQTSIRITRLGN